MIPSDNVSGVSVALATLTTAFVIVAYKSLAPLYGSDGPVVLHRSKLIGPVKTSDGLWNMRKGSTWTGLGVRTSGLDHWTRGTFRTRPFPYHDNCLLHQPNVLNGLHDARAQMTAVAGMRAVMP